MLRNEETVNELDFERVMDDLPMEIIKDAHKYIQMALTVKEHLT